MDGTTQSFQELFRNPLFLQYMSGAGAALQGGTSVAQSLNEVTQQNIASQSFTKMLSKMLSGEMPQGGKLTMSDKGTQISLPSNPLSGGLNTQTDTSTVTGGAGQTPGTAPIGRSQLEALSFLNPSNSQSGFSAADLAGLTPQDISNALQLKLTSEQIQNKRVSDLADLMYKSGALAAKQRELDLKATSEVTKQTQQDRLFNLQLRELGIKEAGVGQTADIKNYNFAVAQGYTGSFQDWSKDKTTHQKDFEEAKAQGYTGTFNEWLIEMRRAGATKISIGEKVKQKLELGKIQGQLYFKDPKWTTDLNKYMSSNEVQNELFSAEESEKPVKEAEVKIKFIEDKISAGGGTVESVRFGTDNKTMIWKVKWPSGETEEIKYGIRS